MGCTVSRIAPFLTFQGKAEEAIHYYADTLPGATIESLVFFEEGQGGIPGTVMNGTLLFAGQRILFMDMDPATNPPAFSWATSLYLDCESEEEFDTLFKGLSQGGTVMMHEGPFMHFKQVAWVIDKYGVCWQPVLE
ncbi:MAG: VOC family protein [Coriobacteriia bacterium]|nr:VOC family protein [Coriobacteriia bacterium]MCL2870990.1 VOC family protein [Coriobacteriia bacterium]